MAKICPRYEKMIHSLTADWLFNMDPRDASASIKSAFKGVWTPNPLSGASGLGNQSICYELVNYWDHSTCYWELEFIKSFSTFYWEHSTFCWELELLRDLAFFDDALNFLLRFLTIFVESFYCHIFYDLGQKNSTIILWSVDALVVNGGDLGQGKYIFGFVEEMNLITEK